MTLSGDGDPKQRREHAKEYRRDVDERRPWLRPALIGLAVVVVAGVIGYALVNGIGF